MKTKSEFYASLNWIPGAPEEARNYPAGVVLRIKRAQDDDKFNEYILVGDLNQSCGMCGCCRDWDAQLSENIIEHAFLFEPEKQECTS